MANFLLTEETAPAGIGFSLFGPLHLTWLVLMIATAIICCRLYKNGNEKRRKTIRITFAVLLLLNEIFKQAMLLIGNSWMPKYLPLHLCSINIFLACWHAFRPNKTLGTFLFTVSIPAAMAAMLFPTWTCLPLWNFMHLHSFTVHIQLIVYPLMLLWSGEVKRNIRQVPKCVLILLVMSAIDYVVNLLLGTNFMFLMYAPEGNPLYWFQQTFGSHFIGFPVLIAAVVVIMFMPLPKQLKDRRGKKNANV